MKKDIYIIRFAGTDKDYYFTTITGIIETFGEEAIGYSKRTLWAKGLAAGNTISNSLCTIRKDILRTQPQKRPKFRH